jgi:hypothetical protein
MTELQEARAKWLDAESRVLELQQQNASLQQEVYELRGKLLTTAFTATMAEWSGFVRGAFSTLRT